jgi:hypothetical protein
MPKLKCWEMDGVTSFLYRESSWGAYNPGPTEFVIGLGGSRIWALEWCITVKCTSIEPPILHKFIFIHGWERFVMSLSFFKSLYRCEAIIVHN